MNNEAGVSFNAHYNDTVVRCVKTSTWSHYGRKPSSEERTNANRARLSCFLALAASTQQVIKSNEKVIKWKKEFGSAVPSAMKDDHEIACRYWSCMMWPMITFPCGVSFSGKMAKCAFTHDVGTFVFTSTYTLSDVIFMYRGGIH